MAAKKRASSKPSPQDIAARAFEIYESQGCPEGQDLEHWLRAEAELRGPAAPGGKGCAPKKGRDSKPHPSA